MEQEHMSQNWNSEPGTLGASAAADLHHHERPGVPEEIAPPRPLTNSHWTTPEDQLSDSPPLVGANMRLTPVYSSAIPPRGLSGLIRRAAYKIPEHRARRWMLLLLADRIDAVEHEPAAMAKVVGTLGLVIFGVYALRAARRR